MDIEAQSLLALAKESDDLTVKLASPRTPVHRRWMGSITDWDETKKLPNSIVRERQRGKTVVRISTQSRPGLRKRDEIVVFERVLISRSRKPHTEKRPLAETAQKQEGNAEFPLYRRPGVRLIAARSSPQKYAQMAQKPVISFSPLNLNSQQCAHLCRSPSPATRPRTQSAFRRPPSRTGPMPSPHRETPLCC